MDKQAREAASSDKNHALKKEFEVYSRAIAVEMERIHTLQDIREHLISKVKQTNKMIKKERDTIGKLEQKWNKQHEIAEEFSTEITKLEKKREQIQKDHDKAYEELHNVKERYNQLLVAGKQIEADLTENLRRSEMEFEKRLLVLKEEKSKLEKELKDLNATEADVAAARDYHKEKSKGWNELIHELKELKALKLHHALDSVIHKSKNEKLKLHQIISYLQHQQHEIDEIEMEQIAKRNVYNEAIRMHAPVIEKIDQNEDEEENRRNGLIELRSSVEELERELEQQKSRVRILRVQAVESAVHHHGTGVSSKNIE